MFRKRIGNALILLFVMLLAGCSSSGFPFHADDIQISLIDSKADDDSRSYTVEVRNNGKLDVKYVDIYLYYPIFEHNGSKGNPFKLEGKSGTRPNHIQAGGSLVFTFDAPISEVFGSSALLDWEHPQIELNGMVQDGKSEVPFGMSGSILNKTKGSAANE